MGLSPSILNDIISLDKSPSCNLRAGVIVNRRNIRKNKFDFESVITTGSILWENLPSNLKNADSLVVKM